jgi:tetratricopeptide (TPR) repeat protein
MTFWNSAATVGSLMWILVSASTPLYASASEECLTLSAFRQINETADACTKAIGEAKGSDQDLPKYFTQLGNALHWVNRHGEAIEAFDRALALDKNQTKARMFRAFSYRAQNQLEKAYSEFSEIYSADAENVEALTGLGMIYADIGRYDNALAAYQQALTIKPDYHYARFRLALLYHFGFGNSQLSLAEYDTLLGNDDAELNKTETSEWETEFDSNDLSAGARYRRAQVRIEAGQHEKAIEDLNWLIAKYPEQPSPYALLSMTLNSQKKYSEAIIQAENAETRCEKIRYKYHCEIASVQKIQALTETKRFSNAIVVGRKLAAGGTYNIQTGNGYFFTGLALKLVFGTDYTKDKICGFL